MSIITITGKIVAPAGPDLTPDTSGYDNAGLFGPAFANLGGDLYTLTLTLGPINIGSGPVLDVALSINGFSYDMAAVPAGDQIQFPGPNQYGIGAHGILTYAGFDSFLSTLPTPAPFFAGPSPLALYSIQILPGFNPITDIGQAALEVRGHPNETAVNFAVPNPELGSGIADLLVLAIVAAFLAARSRVLDCY